MAKSGKTERSTALYEAILSLKDMEECCRFFDDLCTENELRSMEQRFDVACYLMQGKVYTEILEKTGAGSATVSRVKRNILDHATGGMLREAICRIDSGNETEQTDGDKEK